MIFVQSVIWGKINLSECFADVLNARSLPPVVSSRTFKVYFRRACTHTHHMCTHTQEVFYQMEVGKSKYCPDGEPGVMYFKKPGEGEEWQKLSDIAARVS